MAKRRNPRVDRLVREAIAGLLETDIADPRLAFVSITDVEVTPDQDVATIYYTTVDPGLVTRDHRRTGGDRLPEAHEVEEGLTSVAPRLRSLLGTRARLRTTPELRFRPDPVAEQAARVEQLLRDLDSGRTPDPEPDEDEPR